MADMEIIYDKGKDAVNRSTHGISLAMAARLDWAVALTWVDDRKVYGEIRQVALAPLGNRLHCVVYVERNQQWRIISLRKANQREFDRYEQETEETDPPE